MPIDQGGGGIGGGTGDGGGGKKKNRNRDRNGGGGGGNTVKAQNNPIGFAYAYLVDHGYSPAGAAGIVGNLRAESGLRTNAVGDGGTSIGIAQWHLGRADNLRAFAQQRGENVYSLRLQLDFLMHELKQYGGLNQQLRSTKSVYDAAAAFMVQFERPADTSSGAIAGRANLATEVIRQHDPKADYVGGSGGSGAAYRGTGDGGGFLGKKDSLSKSEMAEKYGWAMSFLKSEPELWNLFQEAVKKEWSPQEFTAQLRNTKWFQKNSETVRQNLMLQETDPATYKDRLGEIKATIKDLAAQTGATMSQKQLERVAENALLFGWSDSQIQNTLAEYVNRVKGSYIGEAGANEDELMAWARANGVKLDRKYVRKSVEQIAAGNWDMNRAKDRITRQAMSMFPSLREDLKAGASVMDLASGYINSMTNILELNPADVDLFDPKIRKALASKGKDGKPEMKTIWEFEQDLRSDPRWFKTNNAQDAFMQAGRQVLSDLGLSF